MEDVGHADRLQNSKGIVMGDITKRPKSVTVVAWSIILIEGLGLANTRQYAMLEFRHLWGTQMSSMLISLLWAVVGGLVGVVSGIAILRGRNWGRLLYLCFIPITTVLRLLQYGFLYGFSNIFRPSYMFLLILGLTFYIIVLVCLTRTRASLFC